MENIKVGVIGGIVLQIKGLTFEVVDLDVPEKIDILVINDSKASELIKKWIENLNNNHILLINADDKCLMKMLTDCKCRVLTYGFNPKSCVSASSVMEGNDKKVQICVMRSFLNLSGEEVLQQEFSVSVNNCDQSVYDILASVSVGLICGKNIFTSTEKVV